MIEITGTLENWERLGDRVWGNLFWDTKGRFVDGTWVHTSPIKELKLEEGLVVTQNSVYKLGKPK